MNIFWRKLFINGLILALVFFYAGWPAVNWAKNDGSQVLDLIVKFRQSSSYERLSLPDTEYYGWQSCPACHPDIEFMELNQIFRPAIIPSDTFFTNQWYLEKIKAPQTWDFAREAPKVVVAVLDSGIDIDHPDLRDNIWINPKEIPNNGLDDDHNNYIDDWQGWDFVQSTNDPRPKFSADATESGVSHGTVIAGVIAASGNNAAGISGVVWRTQIMPLMMLDDKGEGDTLKVVQAIEYAVEIGADIINLSFVGPGYSQLINGAIQKAHQAGVLIIAAAGNEDKNGQGYDLDETPLYPVCHDGPPGENWVIGVAASDGIDQKASFSGSGYRCVDITAPGVSIFSTVPYFPQKSVGGKYFQKYYDGYFSGTSIAAPIISGVAALVKAANPGLSKAEATRMILDNADNINRLNPNYRDKLGHGRVNMLRAVSAARDELAAWQTILLFAPMSARPPELSQSNGFEIKPEKIFAYDKNFRGGVNVAAGDVDGDGRDEIVVGAGAGGGPQVRIFTPDGRWLGQFFAYDKNFRGGVKVAVGRVEAQKNSGQEKIITAAGPGGGPHVRIFDHKANLLGQFFAYDKKFRGGLSVAAGDFNHDGIKEIITAAGPGGGPHVKIFQADGVLISSFYGFENDFLGGVNVASLTFKQ